MKIKITGKTVDTKDLTFYCKCKTGFAYGCISKDEIVIWAISSNKKGTMKKILNYLVDYFKTNKIKFTNVISYSLLKKLRGFKIKVEYWDIAEEWIICLVGRWNND